MVDPCVECTVPPNCEVLPERCPNPIPDGVYQYARIVVQNGCITSISEGLPPQYFPVPCTGGGGGGGLTSVAVGLSDSVLLTGNGVAGNPIVANVRRSAAAGNQLQEYTDGLYVAAGGGGGGSGVVTTPSTSISFTGDGSSGSNPLSASIIRSPNANNQLQTLANGLYVPPVTVELSSAASQLTGRDGSGKLLTQLVHRAANATTAQPVVTQGSGNSGDPLGALLQLTGEAHQGLEVHPMMNSAGTALIGYGLYGREETTKIENVNLNGGQGMLISDLSSGWAVLVGYLTFMNDGGVNAPPVPTVSVSGRDSSGIQITLTGTVTNMVPFAINAPNALPGAYEWYSVMISEHDSPHVWITETNISGTTVQCSGFYMGTLWRNLCIVATGRALNHD